MTAPPPLRMRWRLLVPLALAATAALCFVAWARTETVQLTYALSRLAQEEERLLDEQRRLRTELGELRAPRALDALAPSLGLREAGKDEVVVVLQESSDAAEIGGDGTVGEPEER